MQLDDYESTLHWGQSDERKLNLLLGNGFSISFDPRRFTYGALLDRARDAGRLSDDALRMFDARQTTDFEVIIRTFEDTARTLATTDPTQGAKLAAHYRKEAEHLKDALAETLAASHPERPSSVSLEQYTHVRRFLFPYEKVYTANYDLLAYWAYMQDDETEVGPIGSHDDGFRDSGQPGDDFVIYDHLNTWQQNIYYLHGALHLYRNGPTLRKITWKRTDDPLINQIRRNLSAGYFPLYVAEGTSDDKLARINTSDYLARARRSLGSISGTLVCFGLSFSSNDSHIVEAIENSKITRLAVSLHGDPRTPANVATADAVNQLVRHMNERREDSRSRLGPVELRFFDAESAQVWG